MKGGLWLSSLTIIQAELMAAGTAAGLNAVKQAKYIQFMVAGALHST